MPAMTIKKGINVDSVDKYTDFIPDNCHMKHTLIQNIRRNSACIAFHEAPFHWIRIDKTCIQRLLLSQPWVSPLICLFDNYRYQCPKLHYWPGLYDQNGEADISVRASTGSVKDYSHWLSAPRWISPSGIECHRSKMGSKKNTVL